MRNRRHIKVPYTVDDLRNYINVARCFDPVLTESAQRAIVQYYVRLRAADSSGASAQSYRITVRQLESCVRLAEAVARAHMAMEVTAAHVKIAFMLLRTRCLQPTPTQPWSPCAFVSFPPNYLATGVVVFAPLPLTQHLDGRHT